MKVSGSSNYCIKVRKKRARQAKGCLKCLVRKIKHQYSETILLFQYCKLIREKKENAKEWMGHLRGQYKERDGRLKEQFINGINDNMMTEIIWELTAIKRLLKYQGNRFLVGTKGWKCKGHRNQY